MQKARFLILSMVALALVVGMLGACSFAAPSHHQQTIQAADSATAITAAAASDVVYITRTGSCYHASGCRYLAKSKIKTTRGEAIKRGLRACSVCKP